MAGWRRGSVGRCWDLCVFGSPGVNWGGGVQGREPGSETATRTAGEAAENDEVRRILTATDGVRPRAQHARSPGSQAATTHITHGAQASFRLLAPPSSPLHPPTHRTHPYARTRGRALQAPTELLVDAHLHGMLDEELGTTLTTVQAAAKFKGFLKKRKKKKDMDVASPSAGANGTASGGVNTFFGGGTPEMRGHGSSGGPRADLRRHGSSDRSPEDAARASALRRRNSSNRAASPQLQQEMVDVERLRQEMAAVAARLEAKEEEAERLRRMVQALTPRGAAGGVSSAIRAVSQLPAGWEEFRDPRTGAPYYYHTQTQETSWLHPWDPQNPRAAGRPQRRSPQRQRARQRGQQQYTGTSKRNELFIYNDEGQAAMMRIGGIDTTSTHAHESFVTSSGEHHHKGRCGQPPSDRS